MLKEFASILIDRSASVKDAMKQLDASAEKILFVVEKETKLIGSLTDGDIRRWILRDGSLLEKIDTVCFKDTFFAESNYNYAKVKEEILRRKIFYVPVIDKSRNIKEFLIWDRLFGSKIVRKAKEKLNCEVVIMAGGKGTRLDPFTRILPKPLIPIGDKSLLEVIIEKFSDYQIDNFYISVNHKAKLIKSYFEELMPSYKLNYIYEDKPLGTVGALKHLENKVTGNILLTNCDIIIDANYSDIVQHHIKEKNDITLVASMKHYTIPYGVCEIENGGSLLEIKEKPELDFLINTGMYVLNSAVIKYIPQDEFYHITHLIEKIKTLGLKVGIYPISESSWLDTGEWSEYKKVMEKLNL